MRLYSTRWLKLMRRLPDIPAIVLCAFILTLVSPACQAMGDGKVWLEICGYNGIEKVAMDVESTSDTPPADPHAFDNCALCQIKSTQYFAPSPVQLSHVLSFEFLYVLALDHLTPLVFFRGYHFESRGPPLV